MQREYWHLTEGLIFAHFAVFILSATMPGGQQANCTAGRQTGIRAIGIGTA